VLELVAHDLAGGVGSHGHVERAKSAAAAGALNGSIEGFEVEEAQELRLAHGPQNAVAAE
jgi:hypothetical protein